MLALQLLALCHAPQVSEPAPLNHQSLDLLRLLLLVAGGRIQTQRIEGLPLQTQVDRVGADLLIEFEFLLLSSVEHDRPEGSE